MALTKRILIRWLEAHDFSLLPGKKTSHRNYRHGPSRVVVTVDPKGRPELSKKHLGMLLRELERAGFDKEQVRSELS